MSKGETGKHSICHTKIGSSLHHLLTNYLVHDFHQEDNYLFFNSPVCCYHYNWPLYCTSKNVYIITFCIPLIFEENSASSWVTVGSTESQSVGQLVGRLVSQSVSQSYMNTVIHPFVHLIHALSDFSKQLYFSKLKFQVLYKIYQSNITFHPTYITQTNILH